ncbi:hypothetical protein MD535_21160 [Vibrio sp. ZSDZ65]|uniref:Uncharacterized protein n=1 Tax=Vibrio qingdaonensis TaxID=2829491 RepID=A0A9X3CS78_9VIBR|nr:hypothetical protein [Vibrio qingdaonensis]MCW8348498.1 hypothetical protein [Vibrio qingdaonensis]
MKSLKAAFIVLGAGLSLLVALLWFPLTHSVATIQGQVISQTLTQSLDGNRHYLTVELPDKSTVRITTDPARRCQIGTLATLDQLQSPLSSTSTYQLVSCQQQ